MELKLQVLTLSFFSCNFAPVKAVGRCYVTRAESLARYHREWLWMKKSILLFPLVKSLFLALLSQDFIPLFYQALLISPSITLKNN